MYIQVKLNCYQQRKPRELAIEEYLQVLDNERIDVTYGL